MTNTQLTILVMVLIAIYLYWSYQPNKSLSPKTDDIIERKGKQKEVFDEASDFDLSEEEDNSDDA